MIKDNPLKTSLIGATTSKDSAVIGFFAKMDSANADIKFAKCMIATENMFTVSSNVKGAFDREVLDNYINCISLSKIIDKFSEIMTFVASAYSANPVCTVTEKDIEFLEREIEMVQTNNGVVSAVRTPDNDLLALYVNRARASVREAEVEYARLYSKVEEETKLNELNEDNLLNFKIVFEFINKVSLYLYCLMMKLNDRK